MSHMRCPPKNTKLSDESTITTSVPHFPALSRSQADDPSSSSTDVQMAEMSHQIKKGDEFYDGLNLSTLLRNHEEMHRVNATTPLSACSQFAMRRITALVSGFKRNAWRQLGINDCIRGPRGPHYERCSWTFVVGRRTCIAGVTRPFAITPKNFSADSRSKRCDSSRNGNINYS